MRIPHRQNKSQCCDMHATISVLIPTYAIHMAIHVPSLFRIRKAQNIALLLTSLSLSVSLTLSLSLAALLTHLHSAVFHAAVVVARRVPAHFAHSRLPTLMARPVTLHQAQPAATLLRPGGRSVAAAVRRLPPPSARPDGAPHRPGTGCRTRSTSSGRRRTA